MIKKALAILIFISVVSGALFGQEEGGKPLSSHKHQPFDVLLGLNLGLGVTPNIGSLFKALNEGNMPKGNYALGMDFGLSGDFYLFYFLSFNTGLLLRPEIYASLDIDIESEDLDIEDIASAPLCLTIPLAVHVNIPKLEWLYAGIGLNLNIPVAGMLNSAAGMETKGKFFVSLPIDIGFDFVKAGKGGGRFFFRISPEFHKNGTAVPIGLIWQIHNWKLYSKK